MVRVNVPVQHQGQLFVGQRLSADKRG
jgi:hypothetical protein